MDTGRMKHTAEWFYSNVFTDEELFFRQRQPQEKLPALLETARSLARTPGTWQSRESVFCKQGKLLARYEDDFEFHRQVIHYFPTYESLTDEELRGYFSWRTKLRRGQLEKTELTFAFLYIYELLNQIGVESPAEGYETLSRFREEYGALDSRIRRYLDDWITDYVVYFGLSPELLADTPQVSFDRALSILDAAAESSAEQIMEAVRLLAGSWLDRCRFFREHPEDMQTVIHRVLCRMTERCQKQCRKTFVEQYFGKTYEYQMQMFQSAVFSDPARVREAEYSVSDRTVYRCKGSLWTVTMLPCRQVSVTKFTDLLKTIDSLMRASYGDKHPVKQPMETKWLVKLITEEIEALQTRKREAEAKKVTIDYSQLSRIRADADVTRERLAIADETELLPEEPEAPAQEEPAAAESAAPELPGDCPLAPAEYRLLQCLLYGRDLSWVRSEGYLLSVLSDGINEKLYDMFLDSVMDDSPSLIEDYIDDLKEMVKP